VIFGNFFKKKILGEFFFSKKMGICDKIFLFFQNISHKMAKIRHKTSHYQTKNQSPILVNFFPKSI